MLTLLQNMRSILAFYGGSFSKALVHLFPDISIDTKQMPKVPGIGLDGVNNSNWFIDKFWYSRIYHKGVRSHTKSREQVDNESLPVSEDLSSLLQIKSKHSSMLYH